MGFSPPYFGKLQDRCYIEPMLPYRCNYVVAVVPAVTTSIRESAAIELQGAGSCARPRPAPGSVELRTARASWASFRRAARPNLGFGHLRASSGSSTQLEGQEHSVILASLSHFLSLFRPGGARLGSRLLATSNLRRAELRLASEGQGLQKFFSVQGPVVPLKGGSPVTAFSVRPAMAGMF